MKDKTIIISSIIVLVVSISIIVSIFGFFNGVDNSSNSTIEEVENSNVLKSVSAQEFKQLINNRDVENSVILDIRTLEEYNSGHIENADLLDYYSKSFRYELSQLNKDKTYYIYCRSGSRSGQTLSMMKDLGFTSVINLGSGINSWKSNNYEIER